MRRNFMATRLAVALESVDQQQEEEMIKLKQYGEAPLTAGLEQRAIALESFVIALESAQDSPELMQLMGISTEGFLGKLADTAKEVLSQMTVNLRKWKAGSWDKMSAEDQLRAVKKANLTFFFYNPKYISNLESIFKLNLQAVDQLVSDFDESKLEAIVIKIAKEVKIVLKAAGVDDVGNDLSDMQKKFKKAMAEYVPSEDAKGDPKVVPKILDLLDKYKISTKNIDALRMVSKEVGMESNDRTVKITVNIILAWVWLFAIGFWPAALIHVIFAVSAAASD